MLYDIIACYVTLCYTIVYHVIACLEWKGVLASGV